MNAKQWYQRRVAITAGKLVHSISVNPLPTITANILTDERVCSTEEGSLKRNLRISLTNQSLRVPGTLFNWRVNITNADGTTAIANAMTGSTLAVTSTTDVEADATTGSYILAGNLKNTTLTPLTITYSFYPTISTKKCIGLSKDIVVQVKPVPTVADIPNQPVGKPAFCRGEKTTQVRFAGTGMNGANVAGTIYNWINEKSAIGLKSADAGDIDPFAVINAWRDIIQAKITVTPTADGCVGAEKSFSITAAPIPSIKVSEYITQFCSGQSPEIKINSLPNDVNNTLFRWSVTARLNTITGYTEEPVGKSQAVPLNARPPAFVNTISEKLTSTSNSVENVTYHFTPIAYQCIGEGVEVTVKVNPVPTVEAGPSELCSRQTTNVSITSANVANSFFTWTVNPRSYGAIDQTTGVPGPIAQTLTLPDDSTTPQTIVYTIEPQVNGCKGNPVAVNVTINPLPFLTATSSSPVICQKTATDITLTSTLPHQAKYTWTLEKTGVAGGEEQTTPAAVSTIQQFLTLLGPLDGEAIYTVSTVSDKGCNSSNKASVKVNIIHGPVITKDITDQLYCDDKFLQLAANSDSERSIPYTVQWQESQDNGITWHVLTEKTPYFGVNANVLLINPIPTSFSGNKYRLSLNSNTCPEIHSSVATVTALFAKSSVMASSATINYGEKIFFFFTQPPDKTTFRWDFGDGWTSILQNPSHYYYPPVDRKGPYKVTVDAFGDEFACRHTFSVPDITISRPQGQGGDIITGDQRVEDVIAFPIPFSNVLTIRSEKPIERIDVIDMHGKMVFQTLRVDATETRMQVGPLTSGMYVLRIGYTTGEEARIKVNKE